MTGPQSPASALPEFGFTPDQSGLEIAQAWIEAGLVAGYVGTFGVRPVHAERGAIRFACRAEAGLAAAWSKSLRDTRGGESCSC